MRLIVMAAWLVATGAAQAQTPAALPNYDPVKHCNDLGTRNGARSESMISTCLRMEQEAYNALRPVWPNLPASMRAHCDRIAGRRGTFSMLKTCVEMEQEALQQNQQFQFRR